MIDRVLNRSIQIGIVAFALTSSAAIGMTMQVSPGHAGVTGAYYNGSTATEIYTKNYYCDRSVSSKASSGCELGQGANQPPPGHYDPEYAIVPIGFTPTNAMPMN